MNVVVLILAVASGVTGTLCTRASRGFSRWPFAVMAIVAYAVATVALAWLVQRLPVGVVYAVWTGAAAVVLMTVDRTVFKIVTTRLQVAGMAVTLTGVALLGMVVR